MEQRISLITLGVRDLEGAAAFYEALGWVRTEGPGGVIAFDLLGQTLGLFGLDALAEDIGLPVDELGRGALTLAHNLRSKAEVDALMSRAEAVGARILKVPQEVFWGGYHGYFADPDGHIWEIAYNPFSPLRAGDGAFRWQGYGEG
ncbi:VOC family protein [Salipiger sp. P9]|uniref:VOC family protein n=1 Tax=Salipiger pentaromativorans TaxID=2943193 RepID=UPI0021574DDB|nr:VOC family protein [Salipiger pentaromativorans]MCR8546547.1 VOC family protein [Salipiger pentaromativorans]